MPEIALEVGATVALYKEDLQELLANLQQTGYQTVGPRVKDDAIIYGTLTGITELPRGYTSEQDPAHYRLIFSGHENYFNVTPGAQSWKQFFFPARSRLFSLRKNGNLWEAEDKTERLPSLALIGVRPCELAAILIQDRVFMRQDYIDPYYRSRRQSAFILAVNCLHPCGRCFCASMNSGPKAAGGYDLCLTELDDVFLLDIGSDAGRMMVTNLPWQPASAFWLQAAQRGLHEARQKMGRAIADVDGLPQKLFANLEHPHWEEVGRRCLSCANCTQVCPTCFCWDVQEINTLDGQVALRERVWDSCFNPEYSYVFGGNTRPTTRSRYRQWLTHKLGSWKQQFNVPGCVGCGRCITWCPAGIDITAETAAICVEVQA